MNGLIYDAVYASKVYKDRNLAHLRLELKEYVLRCAGSASGDAGA